MLALRNRDQAHRVWESFVTFLPPLPAKTAGEKSGREAGQITRERARAPIGSTRVFEEYDPEGIQVLRLADHAQV